MIEKEILYWMLALNMAQGMWILVLKNRLDVAKLLRQDAEKLAEHYRALYKLRVSAQESRLEDV